MIFDLIKQNRMKLAISYSLSITGFTFSQLYPLATGIAINGVISGYYYAVLWLLACHLAMTFFEVVAKMYDTRAFTTIHAALSSEVVDRSHNLKLPPALVAGRATLLREYVTFLERDIPSIILSLVSLSVALIALFWIDPIIGAACLSILLPATVINTRLARVSQALSRRLNNRLEDEVRLLQQGRRATVRRHFTALSGWRIRLSDLEARSYGVLELFVIMLFAVALYRISGQAFIEAGTVYTIFSYVWRFVTSLDAIPQITQQIAKLLDINARIAGLK
jgi:ABC-type multidrug transport system fused ATPase/permease subunit